MGDGTTNWNRYVKKRNYFSLCKFFYKDLHEIVLLRIEQFLWIIFHGNFEFLLLQLVDSSVFDCFISMQISICVWQNKNCKFNFKIVCGYLGAFPFQIIGVNNLYKLKSLWKYELFFHFSNQKSVITIIL